MFLSWENSLLTQCHKRRQNVLSTINLRMKIPSNVFHVIVTLPEQVDQLAAPFMKGDRGNVE